MPNRINMNSYEGHDVLAWEKLKFDVKRKRIVIKDPTVITWSIRHKVLIKTDVNICRLSPSIDNTEKMTSNGHSNLFKETRKV